MIARSPLLWAFGLLVFLQLLATGIRSFWIGPSRVIAAFFGQGSQTDEIINWTLRMPRVALAVLAGAALRRGAVKEASALPIYT